MSDLPKNITGSISLRFKAWLYADGSKISSYNASLARYLQDQLPSDSLWTVTEVLDTGLAKPGPKQSFIPIQAILVADLASMSKLSNYEEEVFTDIFDLVHLSISRPKSYKAIGLDINTTWIVFWSLFDVKRPYDQKVSRWVSHAHADPYRFPVGRISEVLMSLSTVDTRKPEHAHEKCGTGATLACIEYQIYEHRYLLYQLMVYYKGLLKENEVSNKVNENSQLIIDLHENLEALHRNFGGLTDLVNKLGDLPMPKGTSSRLHRIIRRLLILLAIRRRPIPIETVAPKKRAFLGLDHLGRRAHTLSLYVHLRQAEHLTRLHAACATSPEGAERSEMCERFGLSQKTLADPVQLTRTFKHQVEKYMNEHEQVLQKFTALVNIYSEAMGKKGGPAERGEVCRVGAKGREFIEQELERGACGPVLERSWDSDSEMCDEKLG